VSTKGFGHSISFEKSWLTSRLLQQPEYPSNNCFLFHTLGYSEMKARLSISACTLMLVLCNSSFQNVVRGADVAAEKSSSAISDLALQKGGVLNGQVISVQGTSLPNAEVAAFRLGQQVASEKTQADGKFQFTGLRPGVHEVITAGGREQFRVWAPGTAPPRAKLVARIVDGSRQTFSRAPRRGRLLNRGGLNSGRLLGFGVGVGIIGGTAAIISNNVSSSPGS
jgi:hypothetical protein